MKKWDLPDYGVSGVMETPGDDRMQEEKEYDNSDRD